MVGRMAWGTKYLTKIRGRETCYCTDEAPRIEEDDGAQTVDRALEKRKRLAQYCHEKGCGDGSASVDERKLDRPNTHPCDGVAGDKLADRLAETGNSQEGSCGEGVGNEGQCLLVAPI